MFAGNQIFSDAKNQSPGNSPLSPGVQSSRSKSLLSDSAGSWCLAVPNAMVWLAGIAFGATLIMLSVKGDDIVNDLPWWVVLIPAISALAIFLIVFTIAVIAWVYLAYLVLTGNAEVEGDFELRLDVLFRTAKVCILGHGYVQLLILAVGLLLLKLTWWPSLPLVYPMLPLIVLGFAYIFLAVMLKQPEVDFTWYSIAGLSLLSQCIMLVVKLDYAPTYKRLPWAAVFTPAWLTYVLLLVYCVVSPIHVGYQEIADEHHRTWQRLWEHHRTVWWQ